VTRYTESAQVDPERLNFVSSVFEETGHMQRRAPNEDVGIDAETEAVVGDQATVRTIKVQCGTFKSCQDSGSQGVVVR
jgi:hypothetical protein